MSTQGPGPDIGTLSIIDETAIENDDPIFTKEELEQFSYPLLRNLAAHAETDAINGKSNKLEIIAYFNCQASLGDY